MVVNKHRPAMMIINPLKRHPHQLNHLLKAKGQDTPVIKDHLSLACHTGSDPKVDQVDHNKVISNIIHKMLSKTTVTLATIRPTTLLETPTLHLLLNLNPTHKTPVDKAAGDNPTGLIEGVKLYCNSLSAFS